MHERALKAKGVRDEIVTPHSLEEGDWVLVRHERPQKFETKWFGPYQIVQRMLLGTYRLHDPDGRELQALVHGNRLIKANIRTTDELRKLWASPATKDALRRRNIQTELVPSDPENTDALERYLLEIDIDDPDPGDGQDGQDALGPVDDQEPELIVGNPHKRRRQEVTRNESITNEAEREREILDEIVVQMEPRPKRSRLNATPSST